MARSQAHDASLPREVLLEPGRTVRVKFLRTEVDPYAEGVAPSMPRVAAPAAHPGKPIQGRMYPEAVLPVADAASVSTLAASATEVRACYSFVD